MAQTTTAANSVADTGTRTLPPVAAPQAVADSGLIRLGAAVGGPVRR